LRELQERLALHPQLALSDINDQSERKTLSSTSRGNPEPTKKRPGSGDSKRFGAVFSDLSLSQPVLEFCSVADTCKSSDKTKPTKDILEALKYIDDEEDQLSEAESFHSLGKHLGYDHEAN
jgi:hypothetical protein